jgi:hypothetical protein
VGCRDPLLLVTSLAACFDIVRHDRLRSAIKALSRDFKSSGWQSEASQVWALEHQRVLVLVLAQATLVTLCLGEETAEQILAQPVQRGKHRFWHARNSLFRLGRDRLAGVVRRHPLDHLEVDPVRGSDLAQGVLAGGPSQ